MTDNIDDILKQVQAKDASVLCREVTSIGDTMDVLRAKWNVEILTAVLCGQTRFKDIMATVKAPIKREKSDARISSSEREVARPKAKGISEKVLADRLMRCWSLFPGTPLLEEAEHGEFTPLTERELMQELLTFLELLTCDCELNTHHTSSMRSALPLGSSKNLTGPDFLKRKPQILEALRYGIEHFDMDELTQVRQNKRTL